MLIGKVTVAIGNAVEGCSSVGLKQLGRAKENSKISSLEKGHIYFAFESRLFLRATGTPPFVERGHGKE